VPHAAQKVPEARAPQLEQKFIARGALSDGARAGLDEPEDEPEGVLWVLLKPPEGARGGRGKSSTMTSVVIAMGRDEMIGVELLSAYTKTCVEFCGTGVAL